MQKHLASIFLLLTFITTSYSISPEINEFIQDHKKAFQNLEPHISSISVKTHINKSYQHLPFASYVFKFYQYLSPQHIVPLLTKYQLSREELQNATRIESAKKGLIAGIALACGIQAMKLYPSKKMEYLGCILICAGIIGHQNYSIGAVPYYDWDLKKQDDLFTYNNWHALSRFLLAFNFATLSLHISQCTLSYANSL